MRVGIRVQEKRGRGVNIDSMIWKHVRSKHDLFIGDQGSRWYGVTLSLSLIDSRY